MDLQSMRPIVVRRMYTEIGNGSWGPSYGFDPIPTKGAKPTEDDLVGFYLESVSDARVLEEPLVCWPRGLITVLGRGCVDYELCDFISSPHAVYLLSGGKWRANTPVLDALTLVANSIEDRLEHWLRSWRPVEIGVSAKSVTSRRAVAPGLREETGRYRVPADLFNRLLR